MRRSLCLSVLIALAALAGYAAATTPVRAQAEAVPFQQGDIVTFSFQDGDSRQCRIRANSRHVCAMRERLRPAGSNHWASRTHQRDG